MWNLRLMEEVYRIPAIDCGQFCKSQVHKLNFSRVNGNKSETHSGATRGCCSVMWDYGVNFDAFVKWVSDRMCPPLPAV